MHHGITYIYKMPLMIEILQQCSRHDLQRVERIYARGVAMQISWRRKLVNLKAVAMF